MQGGRRRTRAHLLAEGPLEQSVVFPSHHHKEQGEVSVSARPVSVQVQPQTHLIAILTGVESCNKEMVNNYTQILCTHTEILHDITEVRTSSTFIIESFLSHFGPQSQ